MRVYVEYNMYLEQYIFLNENDLSRDFLSNYFSVVYDNFEFFLLRKSEIEMYFYIGHYNHGILE